LLNLKIVVCPVVVLLVCQLCSLSFFDLWILTTSSNASFNTTYTCTLAWLYHSQITRIDTNNRWNVTFGLSYLLTLRLTQKDDVRNKLDINFFNVTFHLLFVSILVIWECYNHGRVHVYVVLKEAFEDQKIRKPNNINIFGN
jgi:hypothetical protein